MPEPVQWVDVPGWGKCVPLAEVQAIAERLDHAQAEVERLRRGVGALVATTRCLRRPDSKLDVDPGPCGFCAPCLAKQAYYGDDWKDS